MHKTADSASPPARMSTGCGTTRPGWGGVKKPEMAASVSGSSALPASSMKTCVKWPGGTPMAHSCRGGGAGDHQSSVRSGPEGRRWPTAEVGQQRGLERGMGRPEALRSLWH